MTRSPYPSRVLRVLVVDDDRAAGKLLAKFIESLGHESDVAQDGEDAWEVLQSRKADVVVSDWVMPRLSGVELCRRIRAAEDAPYTYFVFMTGLSDKEHLLVGMDAGADDYLTKPVDLDEVTARLKSAARVVALHRKLEAQAHTLRRDSAAFFRAARTDPLTGIANRLRLDEDLVALRARWRRYGHRYSAALCDIDRFKLYNDTQGHLAGDEALRMVAAAIKSTLREGDGFYRYGGEEFLVLLPEQDAREAAAAMDRVRTAVAALGVRHEANPPWEVVTISVGVAELGSASTEAWLRAADDALYRAKARGRNRVETARSTMAGFPSSPPPPPPPAPASAR
jgi:diguanylate cyclase (GGDEF)-like protein